MCEKCNCENCLEKNHDNNWFTIILLILMFGCFEPEQELNRQTLVDEINKSDLSNSEKKRIIEILLG